MTDKTLIGTYPAGSGDPPPTSTLEPSDLVLLGTGMLGLGFARKFIASEK